MLSSAPTFLRCIRNQVAETTTIHFNHFGITTQPQRPPEATRRGELTVVEQESHQLNVALEDGQVEGRRLVVLGLEVDLSALLEEEVDDGDGAREDGVVEDGPVERGQVAGAGGLRVEVLPPEGNNHSSKMSYSDQFV